VKVFTRRELVAGRFPQPNAMKKMVAATRRLLSSNPDISIASYLGSVAKGEETDFSDLDILLGVPRDLSLTDSFANTIRKLYATARRLGIQLELIVMAEAVTDTPWHSIRLGFRIHLEGAIQNGHICGDPLDGLAPHFMSLTDEAGTYMSRKYEARYVELIKFSQLNHEEICMALSKSLSLTFHVIRKLIQINSAGDTQPNDANLNTTMLYRELYASDYSAVAHLEELLRLRQEYMSLFWKCANGDQNWRRSNAKYYTDGVASLAQAALPTSLQFLESNLNILDRLPRKG